MIINVKVIPSAKKNMIKEEKELFKVYLTVPATEGRANKALIELLAEYFSVKKRQVVITKGLHSRQKVINIKEFETPS